MPPDVAGEIMEHLKWDRGVSAVFGKTARDGEMRMIKV
jgi:hypothetical protein